MKVNGTGELAFGDKVVCLDYMTREMQRSRWRNWQDKSSKQAIVDDVSLKAVPESDEALRVQVAGRSPPLDRLQLLRHSLSQIISISTLQPWGS